MAEAVVDVVVVETPSDKAEHVEKVSKTDFLSFKLDDEFVKSYRRRKVNWGFPIGGGNTLGEITFLTKYSRRKPDGNKERWYETCRRVIEGMYSILKDHCQRNRTPWNGPKAQRSAQDAYERLFEFKWTPPGRGLWVMGTEFVHLANNSAALQNCSFISTEKLGPHNPTLPFTRLMEMSMLGVGVGFDTKGAGKLTVTEPMVNGEGHESFTIPDSREGWCASVDILLRSYFRPHRPPVEFDYTQIRPAGTPIKGFGGIAAGPGPLMALHASVRKLFAGRNEVPLSTTDIVDLMNLVGKCVVSGNVRRSAEIALGEASDLAFLDLKDWERNPERMGHDGWGNLSNNSVYVHVGDEYDHLLPRIEQNGEPGLLYIDLIRQYGRFVDGPNNRDYRAAGTNPCSEQTLESYECCTLVETFPIKHETLDDFKQTLKFAYLYAKAVTLLPTHWPDTNEVMQRNRRIGCSVSGLAQFVETRGWTALRKWLSEGYLAVQQRDQRYSEWLGVRESIKRTSVKPSGTVSLLSGVTPGVHWPVADTYIRRMRLAINDPLLEVLRDAGYHTEPDDKDPKHTVVVEFPTKGPQVRTERNVSVWEKAALASLAQRYWADNQVSATLTFLPTEKNQLGPLLRSFEGQMKSVSFLPIAGEVEAYKQMPYEQISLEVCDAKAEEVKKIRWEVLYSKDGVDAEGESFCNNDVCLI